MDARHVAPLLLIGASGLAVEVAECARLLGREVVGCLEDDPALAGATRPGGLKVLGTTDAIGTIDALSQDDETQIVVCVGHGSARRRVVERLVDGGVEPRRFGALVHPAAVVPVGAEVGPGTVLLAGVVVTAPITIGAHVIVMPHVTLTHDDVVEDYVTLAAGVSLGGGVRVGAEAYLGMNSSVLPNVKVGAGSTLGMGAVLLTDLPPGETWAGVPAARLDGAD